MEQIPIVEATILLATVVTIYFLTLRQIYSYLKFHPPKQYNFFMERDNHIKKYHRYRNFDYSNEGCYFVTICTYQRKKILSTINDGSIILTDIGNIIQNEISDLQNRFPNISIDDHVLMPNHIHLTIVIQKDANHKLGQIIGAFKSLSANKYRVISNDRLWQPNYYDHIIRNEREYNAIAEYIYNNPSNWPQDEYF